MYKLYPGHIFVKKLIKFGKLEEISRKIFYKLRKIWENFLILENMPCYTVNVYNHKIYLFLYLLVTNNLNIEEKNVDMEKY